MSELLKTAWTVARAGWRSAFNTSWRFSRAKTAIFALLIQAALFFFISRRTPVMAGGATAGSIGGLLALIAIQTGWFGLMSGFSRGQMELYQGVLVPLLQMTPARPLAFLLGRVLQVIPSQAWSSVMWGAAFSGAVPGPARWGVMALLAATGLLVGTFAHLTGLLILAVWGRYSPKTMRNGSAFFGISMLALVTWAIIFLARGGTVTQLSVLLQHYRRPAYGIVLGLTGLPGLALLGALLIRPAAVENLYLQGVYRVLELAEQAVVRPGRSVWLPLRDAPMRAVLSREWLVLIRSTAIRVGVLIWATGTVGVGFAGAAMRGQPLTRAIAYVGALSLLAWFLAYGHLVMQVFEKERRTMLLYRLTGIPAGKLILAKFIAVCGPSAILVVLSSLVGSVTAGLTAGQTLTLLAWTVGAVAAATLGGFGMAAATANQGADQELVEGPPREGQTPQPTGNGWWVMARMGALLVTAALPVWTGAGRPGLPLALPLAPFIALDAALPLLLLVTGYWLMTNLWERNA